MALQWDIHESSPATSTSWTARLPDERELRWEGFFTGPLVLSDHEIEAAARHLLDSSLSEVSDLASSGLRSYVATPGQSAPSMLLHSATSTTKGFEGDLADLMHHRVAHDVATYLEARSVYLGHPGDIAVGRTQPWRDAAIRAGLRYIDLGETAYYYLSQALLVQALRSLARPVTAIDAMADWLRQHPDGVIRLYALDIETQIFLVWLKRLAGLAELFVDANSPEVSATWNQKTHIHPTANAARMIQNADRIEPTALLAREQRESLAHQRLGMTVPVIPGYLVPRNDDAGSFARELRDAAMLLIDRYGIRYGCFKPCEAGDGARIVPNVDLADEDTLRRHANDAFPHGDHYLLEANVAYARFEASGHHFDLAPSGHVHNGHVAHGMTVQLMNGCSWAGNAYFDERALPALGISQPQYAQMIDGMHSVRDAFYGEQSVREGCHAGLVTGGIDFAIGTVGGRFGDQILIGAIDFNLSSHGGAYMRAFQDELEQQGSGGYAATRVYRPTSMATLDSTSGIASEHGSGRVSRAICCVPGRWGMVASAGIDTRDAIASVFALVEKLSAEGLAAAAG